MMKSLQEFWKLFKRLKKTKKSKSHVELPKCEKADTSSHNKMKQKNHTTNVTMH